MPEAAPWPDGPIARPGRSRRDDPRPVQRGAHSATSGTRSRSAPTTGRSGSRPTRPSSCSSSRPGGATATAGLRPWSGLGPFTRPRSPSSSPGAARAASRPCSGTRRTRRGSARSCRPPALFDHVLTTDSNRVGSYQEATRQRERRRDDVRRPAAGPQPGRAARRPAARCRVRRHLHRPQAPRPPASRWRWSSTRRATSACTSSPGSRRGSGRSSSGRRSTCQHIVGSLPYERMVTAYKAYRLFLNVNTVVDSPTMCARRAFEISATSTPVLSGDARALREVFGDLVSIATTADECRAELERLLGDPEQASRPRPCGDAARDARAHLLTSRRPGAAHRRPRRSTRRRGATACRRGRGQTGTSRGGSRTSSARQTLPRTKVGRRRPKRQRDFVAFVDPAVRVRAALPRGSDRRVRLHGRVRGRQAAGRRPSTPTPSTCIRAAWSHRRSSLPASRPVRDLLDACAARGLRGYAADGYSFRAAAVPSADAA